MSSNTRETPWPLVNTRTPWAVRFEPECSRPLSLGPAACGVRRYAGLVELELFPGRLDGETRETLEDVVQHMRNPLAICDHPNTMGGAVRANWLAKVAPGLYSVACEFSNHM